MTLTRSRGRLAVAVAGIALMSGALLTACASSSGSGDGASGSGGGGVSNATFEQEMTAWTEKFDSCMRDEGIDVPKRSSSETLDLDSLGIDGETYQATATTCTKKIGQPPVDPNVPSADELYTMQLTFAKCMRDAGYEWDDPAPPSDAGAAGTAAIEAGKYDEKTLEACAVKAGFGTDQDNG
ncbi:hypothetical protein [Microbacterium sp. ZW T5_56]|uniref:hypothetical protein n=1 Tax=Microbacterium sp. ZW T5_56 TaxID=3378081 RepID=UPI0038546596